jgi:hypothetical protein
VLEIGKGPRRQLTEDSVGASAVEPQLVQRGLEGGDIVAAQVWRREVEQPVAQRPPGLDERQPGLFVAVAGDAQSAGRLELRDGILGGRAEDAALGAVRGVPGCAEAALQISDGFAGLARRQWEVARNSSSS